MWLKRTSGPIDKAASALAAANGIAHVVFLSLFGWRFLTSGPIGKALSLAWAVCAGLGLVSSAVGWALVRHGGRTKVRTIGLWAVAASTALAALLLFVASWSG